MRASKLFLCNFSSLNIYQTIFQNVCVEKTACFYFCPHFYKEFVAGFSSQVCYLLTKKRRLLLLFRVSKRFCLRDFDVKTDFSEPKKDFTDLKKLLIQYYYVYDNSSFMENFSYSIYEKKILDIIYLHT